MFTWTNPKSFSPSHPRAFTKASFKRFCPAFSSAAFSTHARLRVQLARLGMDLLVSFDDFASGREPDPLPGLHMG